jgi:quercetin dioxygenase-like cupin family protein
MSEAQHPLVVQATDDGYIDGRAGAEAFGVEIDPRDVAEIQELLSGALVGSKDLNIGLCRMPPGSYHIRHHHPDGSEFYYFIEGGCVVTLDDSDIRARPGTAIYIPPNCVHAVRNDTDEPALFLYGLSKPEYRDIGLVYDE